MNNLSITSINQCRSVPAVARQIVITMRMRRIIKARDMKAMKARAASRAAWCGRCCKLEYLSWRMIKGRDTVGKISYRSQWNRSLSICRLSRKIRQTRILGLRQPIVVRLKEGELWAMEPKHIEPKQIHSTHSDSAEIYRVWCHVTAKRDTAWDPWKQLGPKQERVDHRFCSRKNKKIVH